MFYHLDANENTNKCVKCNKVFAQKWNLTEHKKICGKSNSQKQAVKRFSCAHCNKQCSRKTHLAEHIRAKHFPHERDRFDCLQCGKSYSRPSSLENHHKTCGKSAVVKYSHKNYSCDHCHYKTTVKAALRDHIQVKHMPQKERIYNCHMCEDSFKMYTYLRNHIKFFHNPEGQIYKCYKCGRELSCGSTLKTHLKLCTRTEQFKKNLRPFVCDVCGYTTTWKSNLRRHIKKDHLHTVTQKCIKCRRVFGSKNALGVHSRTCSSSRF